MYNVDDYVVYQYWLCKVSDIKQLDYSDMGFQKDVTYYIMKSLFEKETFYIPVDHVDSLRQPLSKEDALVLIDSLPLLEPLHNPKDEDYRETIHHYDCYSYAKIVKSVHDKSLHNTALGKKLSIVDSKYYHLAEKYLNDELAFALSIPTSEVEDYIKGRLQSQGETKTA